VLEPGSSAGILVYENVWAGPFAAAVRRSGGQLVASGRIPVQAVLAAPPEQYAAPQAALPARGSDMDNKRAQLKDLGALKDQGVLTDAEFEVQKNKILNS